jgi:hypothetical protein
LGNSIKAALLSGLVFPGLGHIYLEKYGRAAVLAASAAISLAVLMWKIVQQANQITVQIQRGDIAANLEAITNAVTTQARLEEPLLNYALATLVVVWLFGVIDAFRAGRIARVRQQRSV